MHFRIRSFDLLRDELDNLAHNWLEDRAEIATWCQVSGADDQRRTRFDLLADLDSTLQWHRNIQTRVPPYSVSAGGLETRRLTCQSHA